MTGMKKKLMALAAGLAIVAGSIFAASPAYAGGSVFNGSTNGKSICYITNYGNTYCSSPGQVMYNASKLILPPRSCVYTTWALVQCSQGVTRWLTVPSYGGTARMH